MKKKLGLWRKVVAIAAASALSVVGVAGAANAGETPSGIGNIDQSAMGSIIVHKYDGGDGKAGDGTVQESSMLGNPLKDAGFTVYKVTNVDLSTAAGWDYASSNPSPSSIADSNLSAVGAEKLTDSAGEATFSNLPVALYLVKETTVPTGAIAASPAFLVSIPLPQTGGKWLYDVNVYPKNTVKPGDPKKTVQDPSAPVLGSTVKWDITAPVDAKGKKIASFEITDALDSRLEYVSASVDGFADGDYTITNSGQNVTITFTAAGLKNLTATTVVKAQIVTKVKSHGDGLIKNTAVVNTNGSKTNTNDPSSNWGSLRVLKYAKGSESTKLANAEFDVKDKNGTKVGSFTTGSDGTGSITLWVGNDSDTTEDYTFVETKAPAGYVLDATPHAVTLTAGTVASSELHKVANTQQGHPSLPLTGANGKLLATIAGISLLLIAGGVAIVANNRRKRQA